MDDVRKLKELQAKGYCLRAGTGGTGFVLEKRNERSADSIGGAVCCGGLSKGLVCGTLTGAACMLSLFDAVAAREEMIPELVEWFEDENIEKYGSVNCDDILEHERSNRVSRCPLLMEETYLQAKDILLSHGFDVESFD